jgi:hypothetical protein
MFFNTSVFDRSQRISLSTLRYNVRKSQVISIRNYRSSKCQPDLLFNNLTDGEANIEKKAMTTLETCFSSEHEWKNLIVTCFGCWQQQQRQYPIENCSQIAQSAALELEEKVRQPHALQ